MSDDNVAIDADGRTLPYTSDQVRDVIARMIDEGDLVAVIVRGKTGELAVQVFGPPSRELLALLEQATQAYRVAIRGH